MIIREEIRRGREKRGREEEAGRKGESKEEFKWLLYQLFSHQLVLGEIL